MIPLYQPSELKKLLESLGHKPNKNLGQNFLIDGNILDKIVSASDISSQDHILEVGPGPGALTQALLKTEAKVTAVELDQAFATHLQEQLPTLDLIVGDILKVPLPDSLTKVVANLPYYITSATIERLLTLPHLTSLTLMMQSEVATKILSQPKESGYGPLSILCSAFGDKKRLFKVKASSFYPKPAVESSVIQLTNIKRDINLSQFLTHLKKLFSLRRKTLGRIATELQFDSLPNALSLRRPEELSWEEHLSLFSSTI